MEVKPHPHWPKKEPKTLEEIKEHLISHLDFLFFNAENIQDIEKVTEWLKNNSQELLDWEERDSFFTLFTPFHTGSPSIKQALEKYDFPEKLRQFLEICTSLEKTTDQFAYAKTMYELKDKEEMILNLESLLAQMPTKEEFADLVNEIK